MSRVFNWGIIGLGHSAHDFANELKLLPNTRLYAIAARSKDRANAFAEQFNIPFSFSSIQHITACPELDIIYIAAPPGQGYEAALMCLDRRIPVVCTMPIALNSAEGNRVIMHARAQRTFLMEGITTRFLPSVRKALELIDKGVIGEVLSMQADFGIKTANQFEEPSGQCGSLMKAGIYPLFLSLLLFGKPRFVKAISTVGQDSLDESCGMLLKYADNKLAILHASIVGETPAEAYICGERGSIRINARWNEPSSITLMMNGREPTDFFFEYPGQGYHYLAQEAMYCLANSRSESDLLGLVFSSELMDLLDKVRLSAGISDPLEELVPAHLGDSIKTDFSLN